MYYTLTFCQSTVGNENRKWLTEILTWLVAAEGAVTLTLVKEAAEWFLGDERLQFDEFVKVDCGTLLHLISAESELFETRIELVHETLRTFLTDGEACSIPIPLRDAHDHILSICLDVLSSERENTILHSYVFVNWVEHISKASVMSLGLVHTFLESDGFKWWLNSQGFRMAPNPDGSFVYGQEDVNKIYEAIRELIANEWNAVGVDLSWYRMTG
jgi:hypothetical protein